MSQTTRFSIKHYIYEFFTNIGSLLGWLCTFLPTSGMWMGLMAIPAFSYIYFLFKYGISITTGWQSFPVTMKISRICLLYFFYCYFFLLIQRIKHKTLITTGPYKRMRHPQYLVILLFITILTLTLTLSTRYVFPIWPFLTENSQLLREKLYFIMLIEILIYAILILIEEYSLKQRFPEEYTQYRKQTWLLFPKFTITKEGMKQNLPIILGWFVFLCTGMPVRASYYSGDVQYITVKPLGYVLYRYILKTNYYQGLMDYLAPFWFVWSSLLMVLITIIVIVVIQLYNAKYLKRRKQISQNSDGAYKPEKLEILPYMLFLILSFIVNLMSMIFRTSASYFGFNPWEISAIWHCVITIGQIIIFVGLLLYTKKRIHQPTTPQHSKLNRDILDSEVNK